jgi:deoxyribose-phosphate aldolase
MAQEHHSHCAHAAMETIKVAQEALHLLDLTNLDDIAQEHAIMQLCQQAIKYKVAAVCLYPQFVQLAKTIIAGHAIKIATVANFPDGDKPISEVTEEIKAALADGADEIDVVMPYRSYLAGEAEEAISFIKTCKSICKPTTVLKVILETGAFSKPQTILEAARAMIVAGADFLKTSTGKHTQGSSLVATVMLLEAIKEAKENSKLIGLKVAGGIRTIQQISAYFALTKEVVGEDFLQPNSFRIGASSLLYELLHYSSGNTPYRK